MYLSVVIPVYNASSTIGQVVDDCFASLSHLDFEIVLVDDGSADNTGETIFALAQKHSNIKAVSLQKNVGEYNAVMCGLNYASGEYTAIIDDDGQNPPKEILKLLAEAEKGYDVVYARYEKKMHDAARNLGSFLSNLAAVAFVGKPLGLYLSSFKIIHRKVLEQMLGLNHGTGHIDSQLFKCNPYHSSVVVAHKAALIPSRYNYAKLTGTSLYMLVTGKNKPFILLLSLLLVPILFFFAIGNIMSDMPIDAYHTMLFNVFIFLLFCDIIFFSSLLIATIYFSLQKQQLMKEYQRAKKSFDA